LLNSIQIVALPWAAQEDVVTVNISFSNLGEDIFQLVRFVPNGL
jgi:hypothetical protein